MSDPYSILGVKPEASDEEVKRAYRELEAEGYIDSVAGKGSFVANDKQVDQGRIDKLLAQFEEAVTELSYMGYPKSDLIRRIEEGGAGND